jgi:hypothetical protein
LNREALSPISDPVGRAQGAVGGSPDSHARWLLKFAQAALTGLKGDDLLQLRMECAVFLGSDLQLRRRKGGVSPSQLPSQIQLKQWQQDLNQGLTMLARGQAWSITTEADNALRVENGRLVSQTTLKYLHEVDKFSVTAWEVINNVRDFYRHCERQECNRPFLRTKRQTFCSARCRGTVNKRKYRLHHP